MDLCAVYAEAPSDYIRMGAYEVTRSILGVGAGFVGGCLDTTYDVYDNFQQFKDKILNYNPEDDTFTLPTDGNGNVIISQDFYDSLKNAADNGVYRLDGYYLIEQKTTYHDWARSRGISEPTINSFYSDHLLNYPEPYFFESGINYVYLMDIRPDDSKLSGGRYCFFADSGGYLSLAYISDTGSIGSQILSIKRAFLRPDSYNRPENRKSLKLESMLNGGLLPSTTYQLFYNESAAKKHLQGDYHYVPKVSIPSGGLKIPVGVINTNELGDIITKNIKSIDATGLSPEEVQALIDAAVKKALDEYTVDTSTVTPTPAPAPTDAPTPVPPATGTPTPAPDYTSSLEDIYNWLVSSGKKQDAFESRISAYLEGDSKRLDSIVTILEDMLNKDPPGNCPYDYGELSGFLSSLWERSDKKLDDVIKLLEENNSYQKKLLSSLNDIKALLAVDTVMDTFKDRSSETADRAKEKFPLSIPWDVAMVVNTMCAEPKTPVVRCPIVISSLNIREEIVIDLTDDEWEKLAKTCRSLLSITFVLYLTHLTRKIFFNRGDD